MSSRKYNMVKKFFDKEFEENTPHIEKKECSYFYDLLVEENYEEYFSEYEKYIELDPYDSYYWDYYNPYEDSSFIQTFDCLYEKPVLELIDDIDKKYKSFIYLPKLLDLENKWLQYIEESNEHTLNILKECFTIIEYPINSIINQILIDFPNLEIDYTLTIAETENSGDLHLFSLQILNPILLSELKSFFNNIIIEKYNLLKNNFIQIDGKPYLKKENDKNIFLTYPDKLINPQIFINSILDNMREQKIKALNNIVDSKMPQTSRVKLKI